MAYVVVEDFKGGLDSRRAEVTTPAGALVKCTNAHINRGGEIEKRKAFVDKYTLPDKTYGLAALRDTLYTFGSESLEAPVGTRYQRLQAPNTSAFMVDVVDQEVFDGKLYVIAKFSDGTVHHFYDGELVTAWAYQSNKFLGASSNEEVAQFFADQINKSEQCTATRNEAVLTVQTKEAESIALTVKCRSGEDTISATLQQVGNDGVEGAEGSGSFSVSRKPGDEDPENLDLIKSIKVGDVEVLGSEIPYNTDNIQTAKDVVDAINAYESAPRFTATAEGNKVIVKTEDKTDEWNGKALTITVSGLVNIYGEVSMSGGIVPVEGAQTIYDIDFGKAAFSADEAFNIEIKKDPTYTLRYGYSGNPTGEAVAAYTLGSKIYVLAGSVTFFCKLNDPSVWHLDETGAGFQNMGTEVGSDDLTGVAVYNKSLAVFSRDTVQIWQMNPDDTTNVQIQVLRNSGTLAPKSAVPYGGTDVYYLSDSGIRSLRARDSYVDTAAVNDVGTAIDTLVRSHINGLSSVDIFKSAGIIEPIDARYWLAVKDRIFVFSYFPGSRINAWSEYEVGDNVDNMVQMRDRVYLRVGNRVKLYGGDDYETYDSSKVVVRLPFLTAGAPASGKTITSFDIAAEGDWQVGMYTDPNDFSDGTKMRANVGKVSGVTYTTGRTVEVKASSSHVAPELVHQAPGPAAIYNLAIHYEEE